MANKFYFKKDTFSGGILKDKLFEFVRVNHYPGSRGPIATLRPVSSSKHVECATEHLVEVSPEEVQEYLGNLKNSLSDQLNNVLNTGIKIQPEPFVEETSTSSKYHQFGPILIK